MRKLCLSAIVLCGLASAVEAHAATSDLKEPTKVVFFFDTEDFIQPRSADAIRDMANVLASEGVKGHFAMVGYLGKKLVDWRRFDVIDALKAHHVGTQTLYHSLHPNITEYTDIEDFDAAYVCAMDEESRGIGMLMAATGKEKMWCSVLPGNGNTIVGLYLYADLGIPFFGGGTGMYEDRTKCGDIWYCNQRHLNYAYSLHLESFLPDQPPKIEAKLDELAKQQVVTFYMHPHMAVCKKHWDWVFRKANLYPFGEWPYAEAREPEVTARYYTRIKAFLQRLKAAIDPPVAQTTPAAICVLTRRVFAYRDKCFATQDYAAAIENMLLAIQALGYASCWYEGHITDDDHINLRLAEILGVPAEYELVCFLPVGVPAEAPPTLRKRPFAERAWFHGFGREE